MAKAYQANRHKFLRTSAIAAGTALVAGISAPIAEAVNENSHIPKGDIDILMNGSQSWPQQLVKFRSGRLWLTVAACVCVALIASNASAQLAPNQTNGFGNRRLLTFTYLQNFDCVDEPTLDLDFNKTLAQSDPNEMQTPICQVVTEPKHDPTGGDLKHTAHLYVLVPMFGTDITPGDAMACPFARPGELCGVDLGKDALVAPARPTDGRDRRADTTIGRGGTLAAVSHTPAACARFLRNCSALACFFGMLFAMLSLCL